MGLTNGMIGGNITEMQGASKNMGGSGVDGLINQLNYINSQVKSLQGQWYGRSSTAFDQAANDWNRHFNSMLHDLQVIASAVDRTATGLDEADVAGAAALSGFEGM